MASDTADAARLYRAHAPASVQAGRPLARVLAEAPYLARCSDDKTAARVRPREYAIRYPYMQVNRPDMTAWLIFDLDHANAAAWLDADLPAPNLVVRNRQSGHSHLFYAIVPVCTSEQARAKPIQYMKAIYRAFADKLRADPQYGSGPVAKTPGHPWWATTEVHAKVYELGELAEYVDLEEPSPWSKGPDLDAVSHSRHCLLFEQLRYYAYSIVTAERETGSYEAFCRRLEAFAHNSNHFRDRGFAADLPWASLKATVKSVARWTWDRYQGSSRCHRGAMALDESLPLAERQRLAAARTHKLRQRDTESKIRRACRELASTGQRITQSAVASLAGLTRQTIARYKALLTDVAPADVVPLSGRSTNTPSSVTYGAHQVSAGFWPASWRRVEAVPLPLIDTLNRALSWLRALRKGREGGDDG
ncbi:MAG: replication initiation protein [Luteibacter jiangsuensis]